MSTSNPIKTTSFNILVDLLNRTRYLTFGLRGLSGGTGAPSLEQGANILNSKINSPPPYVIPQNLEPCMSTIHVSLHTLFINL